MNFNNGESLINICNEKNMTISEIMIQREMEASEMDRNDTLAKMDRSYQIMKQAVHTALENDLKSMGGLIGGEAKLLQNHRMNSNTACGPFVSKAITYAMGVLEVNSSMGLIVAAPTAGSSGVIPGAFVALQEEHGYSDEEMVHALFHAGAIGYIITRNATVAGAEGGCQAEVGSASAMAASAITQLMGGNPEQCLRAAAFALSNLLGLVCDPVAGLVESPCQSRNAIGVSNALISAEIALSGIKFLIPFDEMVDAMYHVGRSLPFELRESALGGCAATPSACHFCKGCK
ncbi:L-serine dehydratase [Mobilisporobacter senegalensis]|uniref:L-serine dehydratase n=1 Tax=Mobilisporobacter senegalensis TaxID=1329262 RepID=A0A3N1XL95_9FIRM|nr:L-serine ammonia-lyase, iron-sulfur-dependent, subunit alpha [Mobilisporobacter senegalensis]ROR27480.1 L-serine dehydratase [Mobilisporobacter senegalensis]